MTNVTLFEQIYAEGGWDGQGSGPGSTPEFTSGYCSMLQRLMALENVRSVYDVGCGDWQHSCLIDWTGIEYRGIDCVRPVIMANRRHYRRKGISFVHGDVFSEPWPSSDLVIIKDLIHHLNTDEINALVRNSRRNRLALWVVDIETDGRVCHAPSQKDYFGSLEKLHDFPTQPPYRYGPKVALLARNTSS